METVLVDVKSDVAYVTLNRPEKRNALTRHIIETLSNHVHELANRSGLRALLLKANGKAFCAGMDLGEMQERATSANAEEEWRHDSSALCELLCQLYSLPVPTVAVLQGPVLAGGLGLVLACDIVIASKEVFFSLPEPARGITAAMVTPLLAYRIGFGPAGFVLLSGERLNADKALQFGLCHDVVNPEELDERTQSLLTSLLKGSPMALALTKKHLDDCARNRVVEQVRESVEVSARARATEDAREGLAAFLEKRQPAWQQ